MSTKIYRITAPILLAIFALASCDLFATPAPDEGHFTYRLESEHSTLLMALVVL
jgi:hypothetical protein